MNKYLLLPFLLFFSLQVFSQLDWTELEIPMNDGNTLAADVYLPDGDGPWPVIFIQTPYGKIWYHLGLPLGIGNDMSSSNYAIVAMDMRCHWGSLDACNDDADDGTDGAEAVEWIADQDWCDGKIGTYGPSALANVQYQTARNHPEHLVCCVPEVGAPYFFYQHYYPGGVARTEYIEQLGVLFGIDAIIAAAPYDNFIWDETEAGSMYPEEIDIPFLIVGGWYDINIRDNVLMYDTLLDLSPAAPEHRMILGPWVHGGSGQAQVGTLEQGELEFPIAENWNDLYALQFFDLHMRDIDNAWDEIANITYYQIGSEEWRQTDVWPPIDTEYHSFYLHGDNSITSNEQANGEDLFTYDYDPEDPSPTVGGQVLSLDQGPMDQAPLVENRDDNILFSTEILSDSLIVNGKVKVNLFVSSDQLDTDFAVRLTDVYPDGRSMLISDGIQRMRFLEGYAFADVEFLSPGLVYPITITLSDIAYTFNPGHRLRLIVSSSNYPHYNRNMNTGEAMYPGLDLDVLVNPNVASNTVQVNSNYPSSIELPLTNYSPISVSEQEMSAIRIWPNPSSQYLNIESASEIVSIRIIDMNGKIVRTLRSDFSEPIDLGSLSSGVYTISIQKQEGILTTTFVKK